MNKEENSNRYIEKHIFKTFSKTIYKEPDNKTTRVGKGMHVDTQKEEDIFKTQQIEENTAHLFILYLLFLYLHENEPQICIVCIFFK